MVGVKVWVGIELRLGPCPICRLPKFVNPQKIKFKVRVGVRIKVKATPNYKLPNFAPPPKKRLVLGNMVGIKTMVEVRVEVGIELKLGPHHI